MNTNHKKSKRSKACICRVSFLLAVVLAAVSTIIALGIIVKALLIIDDGDHMLLPLLLTTLGTAGALVKLAGWLIEKEPRQ